MPKFKILALNPGSTSTKIAVFSDTEQEYCDTIRHDSSDLQQFPTIISQFEFRKNLIVDELKRNGFELNSFDAVVGRGGLLRPIESGVYEVNDAMKTDLQSPTCLQHASNLGALIADSIASGIPKAKAYIADPVVVDELSDVARMTGLPGYTRNSIFHALNHKAVARFYAKSIDRKYEDLNLIIAHLGGGISVGAHCKGRVVDVNDALYGDGPFSPERAGAMPTGAMLDLCFSGKYTEAEVKSLLCGKGGLVAHMGYNDAYELEKAAKAGDKHAALVQEAMFYNVAKHIGAMGAVLQGQVDAILVTGGIAHNPDLGEYLRKAVGFLGEVRVFPGEDEMAALAYNAYLVLSGSLVPNIYQ